MIDAYIVRDPQGRVIGLSLTNYIVALGDAEAEGHIPRAAYRELLNGCENRDAGEYRGYTLKREQVAL
jgi:hypothetical protein